MRVLRSAEPTGPELEQDEIEDPDPQDDLFSPSSESPPPLVLVRWRDAWFDPEQLCADDWREDYPVMTVGFLVRDDGVVVSVAQEILPDGDGYRAVTHIPAPIVASITVLSEDHELGDEAAEAEASGPAPMTASIQAPVATPVPAPAPAAAQMPPAVAQLSSQESSA